MSSGEGGGGEVKDTSSGECVSKNPHKQLVTIIHFTSNSVQKAVTSYALRTSLYKFVVLLFSRIHVLLCKLWQNLLGKLMEIMLTSDRVS